MTTLGFYGKLASRGDFGSRALPQSFIGPWAWFRLLEQSDLTPGNSPDRFNLRLRVDGASIAYELRANSAFNPFKSRVLSGFSLPERL